MTSGIQTIAQITDCHLLADEHSLLHGRHPDRTLERVLEAVRAIRPDLVVASGDLTEEGDASAYARLRRILSRLDAPVACLPGNHDDGDIMRASLVTDGVDMPGTVTLGDWRIILLDSTVAGRPEGHLGAGRLASLDWRLHDAGRHPKLVFVHHQPVDTDSPWIDAMGLTDGEQLLERLADDGHVAAVAFGHIHHAFSTRRDGIQVLGTPATSFQALPRRPRFELDRDNGPGFRWFRLFPDGLLETGVNRIPASGDD